MKAFIERELDRPAEHQIVLRMTPHEADLVRCALTRATAMPGSENVTAAANSAWETLVRVSGR